MDRNIRVIINTYKNYKSLKLTICTIIDMFIMMQMETLKKYNLFTHMFYLTKEYVYFG